MRVSGETQALMARSGEDAEAASAKVVGGDAPTGRGGDGNTAAPSSYTSLYGSSDHVALDAMPSDARRRSLFDCPELQRGQDDTSRSSSRKTAFLVALVGSITMLAASLRPHSATTKPQTSMLQLSAQAAGNAKKADTSHAQDHQKLFEGAYSTITNEPLSNQSPADLGVPIYNDRPPYSRPGSVFGSAQQGSKVGVPLPTNEWYLNLVVGLDDTPGPDGRYENYVGGENRVHTIPYIVDTVGTVVGIRLHYPNILSYGTVVQSAFVASHGLTLGTADSAFTRRYEVDEETLPSKLGVGLRWEGRGAKTSGRYIRSSILRGMPYGTVEYGPGVEPTVASEIMAEPPLVDGATRLSCGTLDPSREGILSNNATSVRVERDVELFFPQSDFTWLVFFSRPTYVQCYVNPEKAGGGISLPPGAAAATDNPNAFQLRVVRSRDDGAADNEPLIVRVALANNCTWGANVNFCKENKPREQSSFMKLLRDHAEVYPTSPTVKYAFSGNPDGGLTPDVPESKSAYLFFDWKAKSYKPVPKKELLMFALSHHRDIMRGMDGRSSNKVLGHCIHSLHGSACIVRGGLWAMEEDLDGLPSFMAPRPPSPLAIPPLAAALSKDIKYSLPDNYVRGAGDTYFSGKMLAKLGRIIVIAQELRGLAETPDYDLPDSSTDDEKELLAIIRQCKEATLPTEEQVVKAIDRLREGVEVWLDGSAETIFTFDNTWGGLVSCGCLFNGQGCDNSYPNCPSYSDPGLDFGNGHYNDHHFHWGYHIYAAAIVAQYDRDWGKRYFERVLLMIRDIANPSVRDEFFPVFRQKDWYLGNSWASGIALFGGRPYMNGRNQESSSEAIAAYEGISMFGSTMMKAFGNGRSANEMDNKNAYTASHIFNIGRFLAATEIRSADRYWHVYSPKSDIIYPDSYTPAVVSMMWDTMCQFQTWFGSAPYLAYGIQLLPLTPISERRDNDQWLRQLYPSFAESCDSTAACVNEGWAVLLYAVLATLGHAELAMEKTLMLPEDAFESAGGSGHSLTNTLWYISTRPDLETPYDLEEPSTSINSKVVPLSEKKKKVECGCPASCTPKVLASNADGFSCKERIQWLITNKGVSELGACKQIGGNEYQSQCGSCDPDVCAGQETNEVIEPVLPGCPPCNSNVCESDIGRCQIATAPYLCYKGAAKGGCSPIPWSVDGGTCSACCELFKGC